jgi:phytoene dehydrogenase-like protein
MEATSTMQGSRKIVIIGGGIAGLCAAVYARKCGYQAEVLEMHDMAGGLATSWRRGEYTFETCLHWLLGSNPHGSMYSRWQEVFDIAGLRFVDPEEYVRLETEHGESLSIFTNVDRLETELLERAPQDAKEIRYLASAIRRFAEFPMPFPGEPWPRNWLSLFRTLPYMRELRRWSSVSAEEYGMRFTHPLLRSFFQGQMAEASALPIVLALAWMSEQDAGYAIGGSQAIIRLIVDNLRNLGGQLWLGAKVKKILVDGNTAVAVQLASGETMAADWVISAADGHATIYDLLGGKYKNKAIDKIYATLKPFSSYLQVSLGVARDLSRQPGYVTRLLDTPLLVDPGTELSQVSFRFFHYDPTFAPPGKTAVTCFLPTRNFEFWTGLQQGDPARYLAEKQRVAEAVMGILEKAIPNIRHVTEVIDVSTPATVIQYTGNWKGSMEGWLPTPSTGFRPLPTTLPGLRRFLMVGQWVMPGGGLPTGLMTARSAIQSVCKQDGVEFLAGPAAEQFRRAA